MTTAQLQLDQLSEDEAGYVARLSREINDRRPRLDRLDRYYDGRMRIASLGIAIPPKLSALRTVVGWPAVVVDALDERLDVEGFRYANATDADADLWAIWQANNLDEESQLGHLDALVHGSALATVGSPDQPGDVPIIAVESAKDLACERDARTRTTTAAFRSYCEPRIGAAPLDLGVLYLPNQTIRLEKVNGHWMVTDRDEHNLGRVPVVRLVNRARINERQGRSEITPEIISMTDAGCRTLLGMEVSREYFAGPQRYVLGATEESFQAPDGTVKTAWETYLGRILALERDENGDLPQVGQFDAASPAPFAGVLDTYARLIASMTGLPSDYLGINTVIPASADAIRMGTDRLVNRVRRKQRSFSGGWEEVMRLALLILHGTIPVEARSIETCWRNPEIPTPGATSDAISKQVAAGIVPATSDVPLERLGYSAVERARIAADRDREAGDKILTSLIPKRPDGNGE